MSINLNDKQLFLSVNLYDSEITTISYKEDYLIIESSNVGIRKNYLELLDVAYDDFIQKKYFSDIKIDIGWNFYNVTFKFFKGRIGPSAYNGMLSERVFSTLKEQPFETKESYTNNFYFGGGIDNWLDEFRVFSDESVIVEIVE